MSLSEKEELELLELEEQEAAGQQEPEEKTVTGFLKNIPKSAVDTAKGMAEGVGNQISTFGKGAEDLLTGNSIKKAVLSKMSPDDAQSPLPDNSVTGAVSSALQPDTAGSLPDDLTGQSNAVRQALKKKYGSLQAIGDTAYNDPVGTALDASVLVGGAEGAAKLAGLDSLANGLGKITNPIGAITPSDKTINATADMIDNVATGAKRRSLGFTRGQIGKNPDALSAANDASKTIFDKAKISNTDNAVDMMKKVQNIQDTSGAEVGRIRDFLDQVGETVPRSNALKQLTEMMPDKEGGAYDDLTKHITKARDTVAANPVNMPFSEAEDLKKLLWDSAKGTDNVQSKIFKDASRSVRESAESSLDDAAGRLKDLNPQRTDNITLENYKENKDLYGKSDSVIDALTKKQASEAVNSGSVMKDISGKVIGGTLGFMGGGPIGGIAGTIAGPLAEQAIKKFGNQTMANSADYVANLVRKSPDMFGKYGPVLSKALQKNPQAFAVAHFLLGNQDANYQKMINGIDDQKGK